MFKSSCVTGRILDAEEFMVEFTAKSTLKHLSWVTDTFFSQQCGGFGTWHSL